MIVVRVDTSSFDSVAAALPGFLQDRWEQATVRTTARARELAPYKAGYRGPHPGPHLRDTIFGRVTGPLHSVVWSSSGHAKFIEFGRGPVYPHHLTPSGKPGFLRWWGGAGQPIFARHAGPAAAQPFLRVAAEGFSGFLTEGTGFSAPAAFS